jgi:predicted ABC-type ATPase
VAERQATLYVIAGPNGAGKSTLYSTIIAPRVTAEFVNADLLARERFGHNAVTLEESQIGQKLAEERRADLMAQHKSLIAESTFSHPSKLQLIDDAKRIGYRVVIYHVNLSSADLAVMRVGQRVKDGGHPVPEDKIRERFVRNQGLIRDAVLRADRAYVYDNSRPAESPRHVLTFHHGTVHKAQEYLPKWTRKLYARELQQAPGERRNPATASFEEARRIAHNFGGNAAHVGIAGHRAGVYLGAIVGETDHHVLQQIGPAAYVAHFKTRLPVHAHVIDPTILCIEYAGPREAATVRVESP